MGLNPAALLKLASARKQFVTAHPKASAFLAREFQSIPAGTVLEMRVTKPGQKTVISNIRVTEEDLELMESLKELRS